MLKRTGVISYNVNERGRQFAGQDRKVNIPALMALINGPMVQELVRKGDVYGYFGHTFREKYGLNVPETVIEGGKVVVLEPTVRTVMIKCLPDGTIQHNQEFLSNAPGRIAGRLYDSKAYGFSSVFHAPEEAGLRTPKTFHGMDFVRTPNYDTNRGYDAMLDSVEAGAIESLGFAGECAAMMDSVEAMMAQSDAQAAEISEAYLYQCKVNDEQTDLIARLTLRLQKAGTGSMLDSADPTTLQRGSEFLPSRAATMLDSADRFMKADLPDLEPSPEEVATEKKAGVLAKSVDLVRKVIGGV
ncbi:hypothetical protein AB4P95_29970 (plasmid) [Pseudomonas sp. A1437]|uniref:hypothetical protein n=1 Tax=Pseudomonas sp. A1437 TaxID=3235107 RepID=UPI003783FDA8